MNRILAFHSPSATPRPSLDFAPERGCAPSSTLPPAAAPAADAIAFFAPLHYEPNYAYPLVVWLRGSGDDQTRLSRVMPFLSLRNYVGVAPAAAALLDPSRTPPRIAGRQEPDPLALQDPVLDAVDAASRRYHVHPRRVFLAGHGPGGAAALRLALAAPDRFAGVLSFCGPFPTGGAPLCSLAAARRLPVFLATGRDSTDYSPAESARRARLLLCAGIDAVHKVYPGGDALGARMLADGNRWLMRIVTGPQAA
ncbi:MAG: hypothetical protein HYS13_01290 [Planctomycetia bacterium]|nr:hypothetical protein [Planctomycetia bacterium]